VAGDEPDLLESGPTLRRSRLPSGPVAVAAVAALLVGGAVGSTIGYLVGHSGGSGHPSASAPATTTPLADTGNGPSDAIAPTGQRCSVQHGRQLQLGVQIVNTAAIAVVLRGVEAILPLRGLHKTGGGWETCGQLRPVAASPTLRVVPGESAWMTVRMRVLVGCPAAYPVQLRLRYTQAGRDHTTTIDEFPDLAQVGYTGCVTPR
jgi:hypothetical protein